MKKVLILVLAALLCVPMFAGCRDRRTDWEYIQNRGKIVIGYDDTFAPMGFKEDGKAVGFDLDLARAWGEYVGIEIDLQWVDWEFKEAELIAKNIDLIWNGYTISDKRKKQVNFSIPYLKNEQVAVVRKADAATYTTFASLSGKELLAQNGSTAVESIEANDDLKDNKITKFKDNQKVLFNLKTGSGFAAVLDSVVAGYYMNQDSFKNEFVKLEEVLALEEYGIGVRKNEPELLKKVNDGLKALKENGTLKTIAEKWGLADLLLV